MASKEFERVFSEAPLSGRYVFRDDFESLENWRIVSGSASVSESILTLQDASEVRSLRKFLYGILVLAARSTASGSLRIGFTDDEGTNYLVWSSNALRYRSLIDATEGSTSAGATETGFLIFTILWHPDEVAVWVNGAFSGPYTGSKIPNKPMAITIQNLSNGQTVYADFAAVYPELAGAWIGLGPGTNQSIIALPVSVGSAIQAGTNRIGVVCTMARLLATPYTDSTTPLEANGSFLGVSRDTQLTASMPFDHFAFINAHAVSDAPGTLILQESPDGSAWVSVLSKATESVTNPDGTTVQVARIERFPVTLRYVRVAYRNGGTPQGSFRLSSRVYCM